LAIYVSMILLVKNKEVLFNDLSDADAANIVSGLKELKLDYQIADDGKTILVDSEQVHEARLSLMSNGILLNNTVGLELFDNADYGMTEFAQKVNFQRALQGEIARTIMALKEVKFSRVHLTLPKNSIFADQQKSAKAAVTVISEGNLSLSKQQIEGIQRLVGSSVGGLPIENVIIVDQYGVDISVIRASDGDFDSKFAGTAILERKQAFEKHLTNKVTRLLEKSIGFEQFAVSIDVNFDYTKTTLLSENLLKPSESGEGFVKTEKSNAKFGDKTNKKGIVSNIKTSEEKSTEYLFGKEVKQTEYLSGDVKSISVAVIVNSNMNEHQLESLKKVIAASVGLDEKRGDIVQVHPLANQLVKNMSEQINELADGDFQNHLNREVSAKSAKSASLPKISESFLSQLNQNELTAIGSLLIIVFIIILVLYGRIKRKARESVLKEIKLWMEEDIVPAEVVKSNG